MHVQPYSDEYLSLPEHDQTECPRCQTTKPSIRHDVMVCRNAGCGYRWRWPLHMGLD